VVSHHFSGSGSDSARGYCTPAGQDSHRFWFAPRLSTLSSTSTTEALVTEHFHIHNPTSGSLTRPPHEGSLRCMSYKTGAPKNPLSLDRWTLHRLFVCPEADEPALGMCDCRRSRCACTLRRTSPTHSRTSITACLLPPRRFPHRIGDRLLRDDLHPMKRDLEALLRSWDQIPASRCRE
jgi:hypothetical protein